jgi:hypothetical protein
MDRAVRGRRARRRTLGLRPRRGRPDLGRGQHAQHLGAAPRQIARDQGADRRARPLEKHQQLVIERNRARWSRWRTFTPNPEQPIGTLIRWLQDNVESIRYDEAAAVIHEEITGLHQENQRWSLGRTGEEVFAGNCDATQIGFEAVEQRRLTVERNRATWVLMTTLTPTASRCGVALYGREEETEVRCSACGTRYPLQPRLDEIRSTAINDRLARAHEIADALTTLEEPLGRELLRKWIQRDADRPAAPEGPACETCRHPTCTSIRRPPIRPRGTDEAGHPLYRFGDVRRRLQLVQEQRGAKLTA